jgi:hypothetical protein
MIKIFERVIRNQLVSYLEMNSLLSSNQHGFRKGRSCLTQLLGHIDNILQNLNDGIETDVIYLDFAKAFDKVDHATLLTKIKRFGIKGRLFNWIEEFLTNRYQTVVVNGYKSFLQLVLSGVPQGTVLGPILFIMYINELEQVLEKSTSSSFADDTRISHSISIADDTKTLQNDLNRTVTWSTENKMELHEKKFELLSYRTPSSELLQQLPFTAEFTQYLTPGGHTLPPKTLVKDLGIYLSSDLSWTPHINIMVDNARKMASWVLGVFSDRTKVVMLQLYKTMVRCRVEYCCPVWNPVKVGDVQTIEDIQRHFTRKIKGCKDLDYWDRLKLLKLQSLQRRRERYLIIHVWKILNEESPNDIKMEFYDNPRLGRKVKVPSLNNKVLKSVSRLYESSFAVHAARLWNTLPAHVTRLTALDPFKAALGEFLKMFPDTPPVKGYTTANTNSIIDWVNQSGGLRLM